MAQETKRLFFGIEIHAPWPSSLPQGRLLDEAHRHLTLAFLGNIPYPPLQGLLNSFPKFPLQIGTVGYFDSCLILPPRDPHVVAWHVHWLDSSSPIRGFQKIISNWLLSQNYSLDQREWNPHVTLCRQPFDTHAWQKSFVSRPFYTTSIHLYESTGNLKYIPLWSYPLLPPFKEIDHTADMAFIIRGETLKQLYENAFIALAFKAPEFLDFFKAAEPLETLDDLIIALNGILTHVDLTVGCPLKAVSFHGDLKSIQNSILEWEMIVDV